MAFQQRVRWSDDEHHVPSCELARWKGEMDAREAFIGGELHTR